MAKTRQKLIIDLETLFPGETISIGENAVYIEPLNIKQLAVIAAKLNGLFKILNDDGITTENYNSPENLLKIASILLEQFPTVLEEASNIEIESLEQLPLEMVIEILNTVISVNLKSKEKLEGNFKSLTRNFMSPEPIPNEQKN